MTFAFDDIVKLEDRAVQLILKETDAETLVMALSASTPELMERVLSHMGNRAAMIIREEVETLGPQPLGDIGRAQGEMVKTVLSLVDRGLIVI